MEPPTIEPQPDPSAARRPFHLDRRWLALLPALLVFLTYLPALNFGLVWDDTIFLREMPAYRDPELWFPSLFEPFVLSPNYFRPLALLTFVAELRLAGPGSLIFHLSNLLLHGLNTALVTLLALRLLGGVRRSMGYRQVVAAVGAGMLYGLHPALIEGVAFVSSRFDLLMSTFLLLALLADATLGDRLARPVLVGLAFLLAALAKEMAVALVLALPFWHLACGERRVPSLAGYWKRIKERGDLKVYAAVLIAGLLYLGIRFAGLGYLLAPQAEQTLVAGSPLQHLLLVAKSVVAYLLLVLWPFGSVAPIHYSDLPVPSTDPLAWVALIVVGLFVCGLVWMVRRAPRAGWLLVGGAIALLPVANLLPLELGGGAFVAERYLLFPLTLAVLAGAVAWHSLSTEEGTREWGRFGWRAVLPLCWLVASVATVQLTLPNWRDDLTLWTWAARRAPQSATPPTNLSLEYVRRGAYEVALELAEQGIALDSENADSWDNAGLALFHLGQYADAQAAFERAITLQPESALFWNNLAGALREQDQLAEAERVLLDQVLVLDPHLPAAYLNLGIVYLRADRPDLAALHLQEAARLLPPDEVAAAEALLAQTQEPERWLGFGDLLTAQGEFEAALRAYDQAAALGAPLADLAVGVSSTLIEMGDWEGASQVLSQAIEAAPGDARLYNNAGVVAREQGDTDLARQLFARAAELAPEWDLPQQNLHALPPD